MLGVTTTQEMLFSTSHQHIKDQPTFSFSS